MLPQRSYAIVLQNLSSLGSLKTAKLADTKTHHEISSASQNNLLIEVFAKKKFGDRTLLIFQTEVLFGTPEEEIKTEAIFCLLSKICVDGTTTEILRTKTASTRCRHILKTVKNVTVAKFELVFTRYRQNLKTVGNLTAINPLQAYQESDVNEMYLHLKNWSA